MVTNWKCGALYNSIKSGELNHWFFFFSFWIGFMCVWNSSSSVLVRAQCTLEMGSGGAGLYLPFPQAGSLELHSCSHHGLVEHLSQSFSFAVWDCTGKDGNGGKWGRRDTGSLRNLLEEHCVGISGQPRGRFGGLVQGSPGTWSLPGLCHARTGGSTTARMLWGIAGQCLSPLGHSWKGSGVLQVLPGARRAQWLHGPACADPSHQHQNLGQIDFKPMVRSVWWCCSRLSLAQRWFRWFFVSKERFKLNFDLIEFWDKMNWRIYYGTVMLGSLIPGLQSLRCYFWWIPRVPGCVGKPDSQCALRIIQPWVSSCHFVNLFLFAPPACTMWELH